MSAFLILVLLAALGIGIYASQQKSTQALESARDAGQLLHLRTGLFPALCSWCKRTTNAQRAIVLERVDRTWQQRNVHELLTTVPDEHLRAVVADVFNSNGARWRRFCCDRCAREFVGLEHQQQMSTLLPCQYCGTPYPLGTPKCPSCGGVRPS